jgi:hypothetical protein
MAEYFTNNSVPMTCPIHGVQMVLYFFHRGPNDPVGNGWICPACHKQAAEEDVLPPTRWPEGAEL